ncbi:hypothetical protein ACTACM_13650 [Pseudomonas fragariae (ex Marin et al. 2024)]|uniref:hypothetical protein n=1 Tax=Pseudomonas fragariae (ex Marin et al. 2024) TaxID=3080056 RepID=UPI003F7AB8AB
MTQYRRKSYEIPSPEPRWLSLKSSAQGNEYRIEYKNRYKMKLSIKSIAYLRNIGLTSDSSIRFQGLPETLRTAHLDKTAPWRGFVVLELRSYDSHRVAPLGYRSSLGQGTSSLQVIVALSQDEVHALPGQHLTWGGVTSLMLFPGNFIELIGIEDASNSGGKHTNRTIGPSLTKNAPQTGLRGVRTSMQRIPDYFFRRP